MPHAVSPADDSAQDNLINQFTEPGQAGFELLDINERELDTSGEKASDAEDYGDIDDDDLPEEEEATTHFDDVEGEDEALVDGGHQDHLVEALATDASLGLDKPVPSVEQPLVNDDTDDLFGDNDILTNDNSNIDDLFGDLNSDPVDEITQPSQIPQPESQFLSLPGANEDKQHDSRSISTNSNPTSPQPPAKSEEEAAPESKSDDPPMTAAELRIWKQQEALFSASRKNMENREAYIARNEPPPPPTTNAELFQVLWPRFEKEKIPRFGELLGFKRAVYKGKTPTKPPKPLRPTKIGLELYNDIDKLFRMSETTDANSTKDLGEHQKGLFYTTTVKHKIEEDKLPEPEIISENEVIGGVTWSDIKMMCEDWESTPSLTDGESDNRSDDRSDDKSDDKSDDTPRSLKRTFDSVEKTDPLASVKRRKIEQSGPTAPRSLKRPLDSVEQTDALAPIKRHKVHHFGPATAIVSWDEFPSFDDPEEATRRIARKVVLDLNDPFLLLDTRQPSNDSKKGLKLGSLRRVAGGRVTKDLKNRYNLSNDDAYDLLKENHLHKIRSTLGNLSVEHSWPAIKLQYPFYKVKLGDREARSFHRPTMAVKSGEIARFTKLRSHKRKLMKGRDAQTLFNIAQDLSMADNSHSLLVEYSEEYPTMLSNFGMGNRFINYYRRKGLDDNSRPKGEIGETQVLLPEDQSPFSLFGAVDKGETTPTLHNSMFRAPVFKHDTKDDEYMVCRSTTGVGGTEWSMRGLENLYTVGQQFPSVEVPGTHSRKVTDTSKRRLKALSARLYTHNLASGKKGEPLLSNEMIKDHNPGSDIAGNRGKMREFMAYDKETHSWHPKEGEEIPDLKIVRSWIKPEDICLLDSMQVGAKYLDDAGYHKDEKEKAKDQDKEQEQEKGKAKGKDQEKGKGKGKGKDQENDGDDEDAEDKEGESLEEKLAPWKTTKNFLNACSSKAMLEIFGEGDPSGRGEAFSFIKTSMKGGFKAVGESATDKILAKQKKDASGHAYNVAEQAKQYQDAISAVWNRQKASLSSTAEVPDPEPDPDDQKASNDAKGRTPRPEAQTPSAVSRRDEDSASQMSRASGRDNDRALRIVRYSKDKYGKKQKVEELIYDAKAYRAYTQKKKLQELASLNVHDIQFTGDAESDELKKKKYVPPRPSLSSLSLDYPSQMYNRAEMFVRRHIINTLNNRSLENLSEPINIPQLLENELSRLERNKERRKARERAKGGKNGGGDAGSDAGSAAEGGSKPTGTQRKCANCGQIGHIKTNKKCDTCHLLAQFPKASTFDS
ncbi:MAG: hypothetical protein M1820_001484 [Bogoriella megaspora]|nr:MAG: hypothetical protein M1820_001484 [Bogoriella megaspora]